MSDNNEEKIIEEKLTEEFPVTEPTSVSEPEATDDKPEEVEAPTTEGGETTEEVPEGDKPEGEEEKVEEEKKEEDSSVDTETENTSPENSEEVKEETPPENEEVPPRTTEELMREIDDLKFEQETAAYVDSFKDVVAKQENEFAEFGKALEAKMIEEFNKYGIPLDVDVDELKEVDPGKYQIFRNILTNAEQVRDHVIAELRQPIIEASENIVFRVAGKEMKKYNLTEEEAKEAANTFVNIMNEVGIKDLKDDVRAKVELAVARAKLLSANTVKEVKEVLKETKADVKEVVEETKEVVKETGKKLEDFTKGVTAPTTANVPEVNPDNVMELYLSKKGKDRIAFFQKHQAMIMDRLKGSTMRYTDDSREW